QHEVARRTGDRVPELPPEFAAEAQFVLASDHLVPWDATPAELYPALVAAVGELSVFDPHRLHDVFPTAAELPSDIDFPALADRPRREGAGQEPPREPARPATTPARGAGEEVAESDRMARLGNYSRASVRRLRAARAASGEEKRRLEEH